MIDGRGRPRKDGKPSNQKELSLSPREVKFVGLIIEGKSLTDAARACGYEEANVKVKAWQAWQKIKRKAPAILDSLGLTQEALIENHLKPLLNATEVKVFKSTGTVIVTDEDGNKTAVEGDEIIYSAPLAAWTPRTSALDMAFKLHGSYARPENENAAILNQTNNVQIINHIERPKRDLDAGSN